MNQKTLLPLCIALLMFPQLVQTLNSSALVDLQHAFAVSATAASQLPTVYFIAFAIGVSAWGWACDRIGRRPAMLLGLLCYAGATGLSLIASTYTALLCAQALGAFGAAVGSVVTQTVLRDRFAGVSLARAFSLAGMVISLSPALGLLVGAVLNGAYGYRGSIGCVLVLSMLLLAGTCVLLPETRPASRQRARVRATAASMVRDAAIWRSALLVAAFNVAVYGYYALGPFLFERLGLSAHLYGLSGILLACGSCAGALLNRHLLHKGWQGHRMVATAAAALAVGGAMTLLTQASPWFIVPTFVIVVAFGVAIPNVLGSALAAYGDRLGTAGALFGLLYYLLIGAGMLLVGWSQNLGATIMAAGLVALAVSVHTFAAPLAASPGSA